MKQPSPVTPTIGRNVRYVLTSGIRRGQSRAAIITQVWNGIPAYPHSEVNLTVFPDLANDEGAEKYNTSVPYDPSGSEPGTWHWPADAGDGFPTPQIQHQREEPAAPVFATREAEMNHFAAQPVFEAEPSQPASGPAAEESRDIVGEQQAMEAEAPEPAVAEAHEPAVAESTAPESPSDSASDGGAAE